MIILACMLFILCIISCSSSAPPQDGTETVYTYDIWGGPAREAKVYMNNLKILVAEAKCYRLVKDDNLAIIETQYDKSGSEKIVYKGGTVFDKSGTKKIVEKVIQGSKQYDYFKSWSVKPTNYNAYDQ